MVSRREIWAVHVLAKENRSTPSLFSAQPHIHVSKLTCSELVSRADYRHVSTPAKIIIRTLHAKTTFEFLENMEHELRVPRHSVRLGIADGQHESHLHLSRRTRRATCEALAGRATDGFHRATDHRCDERSHLGTARSAATVFFDRRRLEFAGPAVNAKFRTLGRNVAVLSLIH